MLAGWSSGPPVLQEWPPSALGAYNRSMARGWESKSVEEQQSETTKIASLPDKKKIAPAELLRRQKKAELKLSRSRTAQQLQAATSERYAAMLRIAMADLDRQLTDLGD